MADPPDINVDELRRRARRRLIGAVVLALAAAVIVPMLLESDPKPLGEDVSVKIPPEDSGKFVNRLSDKGAKGTQGEPAAKGEQTKEQARAESASGAAASPESAPASSNVPAPKKSIAQAEQKMLGTTGKPASASATAPAPAPPPAATNSAPAVIDATKDVPRDGFSVQLAAFSDDKGANSLANKLKKAAYPAYTEPLATSKGTLWRVRVGPYASHDEAAQVRDKLKGEGYSGIVAAAK
jgi:DedD protein